MKIGVCLCQLGTMAQCVAATYSEQQSCDFFDRASGSKKCMHLNPTMNNHCWSQKAQDFSSLHGVVRIEDIDIQEPETIYDESLERDLGESARRNCRNCLAYTSCAKLINLATAASAHGGVTEQDLWNQASACMEYLEETKIDISGGI